MSQLDPVLEDDPRAPALVLPDPWRLLPDGRRAWFQEDWNGCMRACIATALQVPMIHVPDPPGDAAKWAESEALAARLGMRLVVHRGQLPVDRETWIAVEHRGDDGYRHCAVMQRGEILHNPSDGFELPPGYAIAPLGPIDYGITFDSIARTS